MIMAEFASFANQASLRLLSRASELMRGCLRDLFARWRWGGSSASLPKCKLNLDPNGVA